MSLKKKSARDLRKKPDFVPLPISYFFTLPTHNRYLSSPQDQKWLLNINNSRELNRKGILTMEFFEYSLQTMEETSTFKTERCTPSDVQCTVCGQFDGDEDSIIILCDLCNDGVHSDCYGVPEIPEGQWLCRKCQLSPTVPVECALCPNRGGAFKTTVDRSHPWIHVTCAWLHPKVDFLNIACKEPAKINLKLQSSAKKPACIICNEKEGHCIKCAQKYCRKGVLHASCSLSSKDFRVVDDKLYCTQHASLYESEESTDGDPKAFVGRPLVFPSPTEEAIQLIKSEGIRLGILSEEDEYLEQLQHYWLLLRTYNCGIPLLVRTPLTIDAKETSDPEESFEEEVQTHEDIRQVIDELKNALEEIRESPNPLDDYRVNFMRLVQPRSRVQFMEHIINGLCTEDRYGYFAEPVDREEVKRYYEVIKHPMDLSKMRENIWKYFSVEDLERDFILMLDNCISFNGRNSSYSMEAQRLKLWSVKFFRNAKFAFQQI